MLAIFAVAACQGDPSGGYPFTTRASSLEAIAVDGTETCLLEAEPTTTTTTFLVAAGDAPKPVAEPTPYDYDDNNCLDMACRECRARGGKNCWVVGIAPNGAGDGHAFNVVTVGDKTCVLDTLLPTLIDDPTYQEKFCWKNRCPTAQVVKDLCAYYKGHPFIDPVTGKPLKDPDGNPVTVPACNGTPKLVRVRC